MGSYVVTYLPLVDAVLLLSLFDGSVSVVTKYYYFLFIFCHHILGEVIQSSRRHLATPLCSSFLVTLALWCALPPPFFPHPRQRLTRGCASASSAGAHSGEVNLALVRHAQLCIGIWILHAGCWAFV